jgi:hypothetical protein
MSGRTRLAVILGALAAVTVAAGVAHAQIWRGGFGFYASPKHASATTFAGAFNHCRLMFTSDHREKRGWSTDYPGADINFSVRLGELTKTRITRDETGDPDYITVGATDPDLYAMTHSVAPCGPRGRGCDGATVRCDGATVRCEVR